MCIVHRVLKRFIIESISSPLAWHARRVLIIANLPRCFFGCKIKGKSQIDLGFVKRIQSHSFFFRRTFLFEISMGQWDRYTVVAGGEEKWSFLKPFDMFGLPEQQEHGVHGPVGLLRFGELRQSHWLTRVIEFSRKNLRLKKERLKVHLLSAFITFITASHLGVSSLLRCTSVPLTKMHPAAPSSGKVRVW